MKKFLAILTLSLLLGGCYTTDTGLVIRTADPNLGIEVLFVPTPNLVPVPTIAPEVLPGDEVGEVVPDPTPAPPCEIIKGNISRNGEKIYHVPGGASYGQVKINEKAGEKFFCSEEEAVAAGWRKAQR